MKLIPLLAVILLTGCAASTDQLHADAMGCGKEFVIEPNGIVRTPTEQEKKQQCKPFWDAYNKRLESIAKREAKLETAEASKCPRGTTKWCVVRMTDKECSCISNWESMRRLERLGGGY